MKGDAARVIENVAASIADGARVDWDRAGAEVSGRDLRLVRHLRLIDSVAEVYRTLPPLAEDDGSGANARPDYPEGPRWGRLILLDRIGRGASADVFRAWDAELQREVALKLLHEDATAGKAPANARLLQEARRLARIRHPHVVHVYGAEKHEGRIGLWMELAPGRSLDAIVREDGPLTVAEAAHIGIDLCSALAAVHGAGLLHRDVKAQNVLREEGGRTVLMDFGTGEEIADRTPRLAGTPIYLAPEIMKHRPASVQSDIYSVGVLLFYLVTGQFPVTGDSMEGLQEAHREGRLKGLREVRQDVPAGFARVVDRALSPSPSRRYASTSAMEAALRQALDSIPGQRKPARGQWLSVATMVVAVTALVGSLASGHRAAPSTSDVTSLAVLPLKFVSGEKEAPYLADALTDELITTLGQIHSIKVTAHTSVSRFKDTTTPVAEIARQLGVDGVVEGTVAVQRQTGDSPARARVNVRVIRAGSDLELWSGSIERPIGDMLALQAELARVISKQIDLRLNGAEAARVQRSRRTDPAAEQAYLEGRAHLAQFASRAALALDAFKRALVIDPDHANAHAGAARSYLALGFDGAISQAEARAGAAREVDRALELDPELHEAHAVAADLRFYYDWNFEAAEREYRRTLDLEPSASYSRAQYAQFLAALGRLDEAEAQAANAAGVDPLSAQAELTYALILYYHRRFDEAFNAAQRAESLDPTLPTTHFLQGRILEARGDLASAAQKTEQAIASSATVALAWRVQALRLQALNGDVKRARDGYAALQSSKAGEYLASTPQEAYMRVATGEPQAALEALGRAIDHRDPSILWLSVDPRLDPLRSDAKFAALRKRIGMP